VLVVAYVGVTGPATATESEISRGDEIQCG